MATEVNKLIRNVLENPKQFEGFESSASGLTQELAMIIKWQRDPENLFSDAEKKMTEKGCLST